MSEGRPSKRAAENEPALEIHPLTPDRWADLEQLFGERGAVGGCWCMWWRETAAEFGRQAGAGNRRAFKAIVDEGRAPGLLAYRDGEPVGWCAVAPREEYGRLQRSPTLGPVDDRPVWSITCFYIERRHRKQGVAAALLRAAARHAVAQGARIVEGYPVDRARLSSFDFTGTVSMFRDASFAEVARRSPTRPIMRHVTSDH